MDTMEVFQSCKGIQVYKSMLNLMKSPYVEKEIIHSLDHLYHLSILVLKNSQCMTFCSNNKPLIEKLETKCRQVKGEISSSQEEILAVSKFFSIISALEWNVLLRDNV